MSLAGFVAAADSGFADAVTAMACDADSASSPKAVTGEAAAGSVLNNQRHALSAHTPNRRKERSLFRCLSSDLFIRIASWWLFADGLFLELREHADAGHAKFDHFGQLRHGQKISFCRRLPFDDVAVRGGNEIGVDIG